MASAFDGTKVLIVGGAGFVGSNLVLRLLSQAAPQRVVIIDNLLSAERENLPVDSRVELRVGSITDGRILDGVTDEFDFIFHLATYHGNQSSIHDPLADHENNTLTSLKLFNHICAFKQLKKIVYSGAGCAVAPKDVTSGAQAVCEDQAISLDMDSPYSISKIIGEFYAVYFHKQCAAPIVRVRFQNVYGPGEVLGAGQWRGTPATVWRNVIPTFIYKALAGEALPLENEGRGTRDFIYVDDICAGLMAAAEKGTPGDVYNLSTGREISIAQLAETINLLTGNRMPCVYKPRRSWDHSICRYGSTEKASREIGFRTIVDLGTGLKSTVDWTRANQSRIRACIDKHAVQMKACR